MKWVTKMYRDWRSYRHSLPNMDFITCDLDDKATITKESLIFAMCRFLTKVKKVNESDFPGKTLYEILICVQFHIETIGFGYKILNDENFKDVKFTLGNVMKLRTSQGLGGAAKQADILTASHEDYLWSVELLGYHDSEVLLNTVVLVLGKGF